MRTSLLVAEASERAPELGWTVQPPASGDDVAISAVQFDSREVRPGDLFVCLRGTTSDGHDHIPDALDRGAVAVVVDHEVEVADRTERDVARILVVDTRHAMALLSCVVSGDPSRELFAVGVTGTNGKTTTAHLVAGILRGAGTPCGLLGTLTGVRTTPESPHLQRTLRSMVEDGMAAVAMEVSSHALVQHRVTGTTFGAAAFTNLTPDHLDYHGDLESYFLAKAGLFEVGMTAAAVINVDDPYGARLAASLRASTMPVTEVTESLAQDLETTLTGSSFRWRGQHVQLPIPGRFNVLNAITAAELARFAGLSDEAIASGLTTVAQVPGRFEVVAGGDPGRGTPTVVVDYAHTPDGIDKVLGAVREIAPHARVTIVFGCGGDRDREKRPLMGQAAERGADRLVVTSDNPRSEDPDAIISAILGGITDRSDVHVEPDRRSAIVQAIADAGPNDVVVVAGKGHETTQTIGDLVLPFDDRDVVRAVLGTATS